MLEIIYLVILQIKIMETMAHHLEIITQIKKLKIYLEMIIAIIIITIHLVYFQTVIIMKKAKIRIIQLLYLEIII